jgi:DNA-binding NtrC family response regulator
MVINAVLFQYERYFSKHPDRETRDRGLFLIKVIDKLHEELATIPDVPPQTGLGRYDGFKRRLLINTLTRFGWNKDASAKWLGISRETLYEWMRRFHLHPSKPGIGGAQPTHL